MGAMDKSRFHKEVKGFRNPTGLPTTQDEARDWQDANRTWWESHPIRYDWRDPLAPQEFSEEFYRQIDRNFFDSCRAFLPWNEIPFDPLIPFDSLGQWDVLEVGVGSGSHAALLALHARTFSGIDLTDYAVNSTRQRFAHFGLDGSVRQMDAEAMDYPDASFDFVWSWGVIHHSSNPRAALSEIHRVLRPGGRAVLMVYYRSLWLYYTVLGLLSGVMSGEIFRGKSIHQIVQDHTDGALARYYSMAEWRDEVQGLFEQERVRILGQKAELLPIPGGRFKDAILRAFPDSLARLLANRLRMGSFLVSELRKPS